MQTTLRRLLRRAALRSLSAETFVIESGIDSAPAAETSRRFDLASFGGQLNAGT